MRQPEKVSVIVDDMFFAAKINAAAAHAGRQVERVRSREQLAQEDAGENLPSLLIVDLNSERLDPLETIKYFKSHARVRGGPMVGFVSHVQTELIRGAQAAGCDYVLPRSRFTQLLSEIVSGNFEHVPPRAS